MEVKAKKAARYKRWKENLNEERKAELAIYMKKWRAENRDKCRAYERKYYHESASEEVKKRKWDSLRKFNADNPNYAREWAIKNRKHLCGKAHRRRLVIRGAIHPNSNLEKIKDFYLNCPVGMEVDHIIPINCGGWHHELNLQYLPTSLNRSKRDNAFYNVPGGKTWMDVPMFLLPDSLNKKTNAA